MKKIIALSLLVFYSNIFSVNIRSPHTDVMPNAVVQVDSSPASNGLWSNPVVPPPLRVAAQNWNLAYDVPLSTVRFNGTQNGVFDNRKTVDRVLWFYALVAPFPEMTAGITSDEFYQAWHGNLTGRFAGRPLMMDQTTLDELADHWGPPAPRAVKVMPNDELLDAAWDSMPSWAIIPFEEIQPRWKVLEIDGQSPINNDFKEDRYPLVVDVSLPSNVQLSGINRPASNRDPSKLTSLILTGVTALTRATAHRMEQKGITYPGEAVRDILLDADITHISNEVPFYSGCPEPDPKQPKEVFCSSTRYIDLLTYVDADVIELTGNHFGDYGPEAMLESLEIYNENGMPYYGGGADLADSIKPLLLEDHGNRIAFIGCNEPDVGSFPTATKSRPGAAPCDFDYMSKKVKELSSQGYLVVATFQWSEGPTPSPYEKQLKIFRLMADSGAVIVNGSQAHVPQVMEFRNDSFIHYGLGNLFFDQTGGNKSGINQREFIDRHVFYDGRYLGVELITTYLEDYSRPRLMTREERENFLTEYFEMSSFISSPDVP